MSWFGRTKSDYNGKTIHNGPAVPVKKNLPVMGFLASKRNSEYTEDDSSPKYEWKAPVQYITSNHAAQNKVFAPLYRKNSILTPKMIALYGGAGAGSKPPEEALTGGAMTTLGMQPTTVRAPPGILAEEELSAALISVILEKLEGMKFNDKKQIIDRYYHPDRPPTTATAKLIKFLNTNTTPEQKAVLPGIIQLIEVYENEKRKKALKASADRDRVLAVAMLNKIEETLEMDFTIVDFSNSRPRAVKESSWQYLTHVMRSASGSSGVFFLQCDGYDKATGHVARDPNLLDDIDGHRSPRIKHEIVVAKTVLLSAFKTSCMVDEIAKRLGLQVPQNRLIDDNNEQTQLREAIRKLYAQGVMDTEFKETENALFRGGEWMIVLLEWIEGQQLSSKYTGQRDLMDADYEALGRLFLFDLLILNWDRFPSRKAFPRANNPSDPYFTIVNAGNPGNIMFGHAPGCLYSIDPEAGVEKTEAYVAVVKSICEEIFYRDAEKLAFQALEHLWFHPVMPYMMGILDTSLERTSPWVRCTRQQKDAILNILSFIRFRVKAGGTDFDHARFEDPPSIPPPKEDDDKNWHMLEESWRNWIGKCVPRAVSDIIEFVEAVTGLPRSGNAAEAFREGFVDGLLKVPSINKEVGMPKTHVDWVKRLLKELDKTYVEAKRETRTTSFSSP